MQNKLQHIITFISLAISSFFLYVGWITTRENEYSSLAVSIYIIFAFIVAVLSGLVAITQRPYSKRRQGAICYFNFIGTFNICVTVIGCVFSYIDNGNSVSPISILFITTLVIGLFILENVYFDTAEQN